MNTPPAFINAANEVRGRAGLQEARYVIESVICDPNFEGLVLGCIEADFCNQILVGKLSPRSTQCTPLHRSLISKISLKIAEFFAVFFPKFRKFCQNFAEFSPNLTSFFRDFSKMQHFSEIFKMCNIFLGIFSKNC